MPRRVQHAIPYGPASSRISLAAGTPSPTEPRHAPTVTTQPTFEHESSEAVHTLNLAALLLYVLDVPRSPATIRRLSALSIEIAASLIDSSIPATLIRLHNRRFATATHAVKPPARQSKQEHRKHRQHDEQHNEHQNEQENQPGLHVPHDTAYPCSSQSTFRIRLTD